ncbi:ATP-binding cassette domain-containing protein [Azospirillum brasilense]|uniref:ATP-binding cassette domain-containing protein n=1 Tax=Azospirillum brasilense TaxID=192 RepID=UPI0003A39A46|nr:ABC transporter ATP-binding protein [Azospirillum brasilense]
MSRTLLRVEDLKVDFQVPGGVVHAVRGVSFRVRAGSTVALVGESGSGKSVAAQSILRILPRNATIAGGKILFDDGVVNEGAGPVDIAGLKADGTAMRALRGGRISIIFQEPMTSLSPLHTVGDQVGEAVRLHQRVTARQARAQAEDMLRRVRFPDPKRALDTYPFELSGGLRQRAMIAMALVCRPALLIADEPTTALDVTIQAQILKLIKDLQADLGMAVLLITHDLGVVANLADEVVVMHRGRIMESGTREDIFADPRHPYLRCCAPFRASTWRRGNGWCRSAPSRRRAAACWRRTTSPGRPAPTRRGRCWRWRGCASATARARPAGSAPRPGRARWRWTMSASPSLVANASGWSASRAAARPPCRRS